MLPPETTHRHYLSVGLLFPVLFISLSFAIPVSTNPSLCYDAITPNDMRSSMSCAWTGSLVTLGGLGCVVWVFLRSLWLHIRIFWDQDPGRRFKWGSIIAGTMFPLIFLIVVLASTGFSYRVGQTCLPNHEHAIVTFWVWLVLFAVLAFLLQSITTGYCFYVYIRTLRRERRASAINSYERGQVRKKMETWRNVRKLFLLQWRNILVNVFVIIGSISFFIVFWTQDSKLGRVFNDPNNIKPVKTWIICQTLSMGDKTECRKYVKDFTVDQAAVLVSLILASVSLIIFHPRTQSGILILRNSLWESLYSYPVFVRLCCILGLLSFAVFSIALCTKVVRPHRNSRRLKTQRNISPVVPERCYKLLVATRRPLNLVRQMHTHRMQGVWMVWNWNKLKSNLLSNA